LKNLFAFLFAVFITVSLLGQLKASPDRLILVEYLISRGDVNNQNYFIAKEKMDSVKNPSLSSPEK
jgi:hypothetical protein